MTRIVFLNTPTRRYRDEGREETYTTIPPYGLGYVATSASKIVGRSNVFVVDGEYLGLSPKKIAQVVLDFNPDFVGLNVTSPNYSVVKETVKYLGSKLGKRIILGGPHVILRAKEVLSDRDINDYLFFVSTGEGEICISQFLEGRRIEDIEGIGYFDKGYAYVKPPKMLTVPQMNELFIDRRFFRNDPNLWDDGKTRESYMLTSRGCPFNCSFCSAKRVCGQKIRSRSGV